MRACQLIGPTIAALLWSGVVAYGQAPSPNTEAAQPSNSVESRWPTDQSAEPAPPTVEPQTARPTEPEISPAAPVIEPVRPEARKAEPDARPAAPPPKLSKPTAAKRTAAPTPAAKSSKTRQAAKKVAKPKPTRRAKAPSPPGVGLTRPDGLPPFGAPFGSTPFAGAPLGTELKPTNPAADVSSARASKPVPQRAAKRSRTKPVRANKTPPNKPAALLEPKSRPLYSLSNCSWKFSAACVLAAAA